MKRVFNDMSSNNYIDLYIPSHHRARSSGNVHEHIVKAEEYMGRQLKSEEVVHHEDFNKTNNSKDNLFVFTSQANHSRYHQTGIKLQNEDGTWYSPEIVKECKECKNKFSTSSNAQIFCSTECNYIGKRKTNRPTKEHLLNILLEFKNFTKVGIKFNVSDNAIRKWCKAYGLSTKVSDYKV